MKIYMFNIVANWSCPNCGKDNADAFDICEICMYPKPIKR